MTLKEKLIKEPLKKLQELLHDEELKHKLYVIIFGSDTRAGKLFDVILIWAIIFSVSIAVLESIQSFAAGVNLFFRILEWLLTIFFTAEYILRVYCSPKPRKYIFSFFGIIDFLATFPAYFAIFFTHAHYFMVIRAFRLIRVFRVFKLFNFLKEGQLLLTSLKESSKKIIVFFLFVVILVIAIGTLMYMVEGSLPDSQFNNIPNSIYWAIVTLTTVGYGDITPVTGLGRLLSACVMLLGYTIIAVPTGIVSVSMLNVHRRKKQIECPSCHNTEHEDDAIYCKHCGAKLEKE